MNAHPKWPARLPAPVIATDNTLASRAMSLLVGMDFADGDRHPPILPREQAQDVIRWAQGEYE